MGFPLLTLLFMSLDVGMVLGGPALPCLTLSFLIPPFNRPNCHSRSILGQVSRTTDSQKFKCSVSHKFRSDASRVVRLLHENSYTTKNPNVGKNLLADMSKDTTNRGSSALLIKMGAQDSSDHLEDIQVSTSNSCQPAHFMGRLTTKCRNHRSAFFELDPEVAALAFRCLTTRMFRKDPILEKNQNLSVQSQNLHIHSKLEGHEREYENKIEYLFSIYNERGALQAENALERIIERLPRDDHCAAQDLMILQFLLRSELGADPTDIKTICNISNNPFPQAVATSLTRSLWSMALLVHICKKCPSSKLVTHFARRVVAFARTFPSILPRTWIEQAASTLQKNEPKQLKSTSEGIISESRTEKERWDIITQNDPTPPSVMTEVLRLTGIEKVKAVFVELYSRSRLAKEQKRSKFLFNARLQGNPGTGKSTVARYYATFLKQLGVLPDSSTFIEITGTELSFKGMERLQSCIAQVDSENGGVIFIDYAPEMVSTREGLQAVHHLLYVVSQKEKIVFLLSGMTNEMVKLTENNPGLQSWFPIEFPFEDFTDKELLEIFYGHFELKSDVPSNESPREIQDDLSDFNDNDDDKYDLKDHLGHRWTYLAPTSVECVWVNEYGGTCYNPFTAGTPENPIIFNNQQWIWTSENSTWCTKQNGVFQKQDHYPGSKQPSESKPLQVTSAFRCADEKSAIIAMQRIGKRRGQTGFDNARAVSAFFNKVRSRQAERIFQEKIQNGKPDIFQFERDDLLGPRVTSTALKASKAYQELQAMEGLANVKQSVDDLITLAVENARREDEGKPNLEITMNRVFLGNPGTGKTTVARIYAQLLTEMSLLSKGEVILKTSSDFVGSAVGTSEKQTRDILMAAQGSVLVIDEAYSLFSGDGVVKNSHGYGAAVINTLVEQIQARPGDDRAVLLLGYKEEMESMLKNANPGLARRFPLEHAFVFEDYDDEALLRIFLSKVSKFRLKIDFSCAKRAIASLAKARAKPHFGNAGAIDSLLSEAKLRLGPGEDKLVLAHFGLQDETVHDETLEEILEDLVGCEDVKCKLQELRDTVLFAQSRGEDPKEHVGYNYLFLGNPGTGKTTVARRMGKMYKALGLLPDDSVHEVSASDLTTGYTGQASKKTRDVLQMSRGGVLMIDEAYQLNPQRGGQYMSEVVDEIVRSLTSPEFQGKILVLLAGYGEEIEVMLKTNPGLSSRFTERIRFEDLNANEVAKLMTFKMSSRKLPVNAEDWNGLVMLAERMVTLKDFANGRDVDTWSAMSYQEVSRVAKLKPIQQIRSVGLQEMEAALNRLFKDRLPVST